MVGLFPPFYFAQATLFEGNFNYLLTNGQARITAYEGPRETNVAVPSTLGGAPVTSVGDAFKRLAITGIEFPATLLAIDETAFSRCTSLTNLVVPEGVSSIGNRAFEFNSSLGAVLLPESLTLLGSFAFQDCINLKTIRIPPGVRQLYSGVFSGCRGLTNVTIAGDVTEIGDRAFASCQGLTNIVMPASLAKLGEEAFSSCSNLEAIVFLGDAPDREALPFFGCNKLTVYYLEGKTGWQPFMDGRPTKMIPAQATIVRSPTASSIRVGQSLSNSVLSGGSNTVTGTFSFADPGTSFDEPGNYPATVVFTPESPYTLPATTTVQVRVLLNNPEFVPGSLILPKARLGKPFSHVLQASNHTGFAATNLPDGITLDSSLGLLSGTPKKVGTFSVQLSATNTDGTNTVPISLRVYRGTPKILEMPAAAPLWPGQPLRLSRLTGGRAANEDGTEEIPGTFRWALPDRAVDARATPQDMQFVAEGFSDYETATFPVTPNLRRITGNLEPTNLRLGQAWSYQVSANLVSPSFRASGLPPGLRIHPKTGRITGTPRRPGEYAATLQAFVSRPDQVSTVKLMRVLQAPSAGYPAEATIRSNRATAVTPKISGFPAPQFLLVEGRLPTGLSLDARTGSIRGTPQDLAGSFPVLIRATNEAGSADARLILRLR